MIDLPTLNRALRLDILKMFYAAESGHPAPSYAALDIISTLYFSEFLKCRPDKALWPERDYLIVNETTDLVGLYAVLGELGYFNKEEYFQLNQANALLHSQGQINIPGIEHISSPNENPLSFASGLAWSLKTQGKNNKVVTLFSDTSLENQDIKNSAKHLVQNEINNLIAVYYSDDKDKMEENMLRFQACGWHSLKPSSAHDIDSIKSKLEEVNKIKDKNILIPFRSVIGQGVSNMENKTPSDNLTEEEFMQAQSELSS